MHSDVWARKRVKVQVHVQEFFKLRTEDFRGAQLEHAGPHPTSFSESVYECRHPFHRWYCRS